MPKVNKFPRSLAPYTFHGLDVTWRERDKQAFADCPWCGKEGKFSIEVATGKWRCLSCNEGVQRRGKRSIVHGGNSYTFLRMLWEQCGEQKHLFAEGRLLALANQRRLSMDTIVAWGGRPSLLKTDVVFPGYGAGGNVNQLYRYGRTFQKGKWVNTFMPTSQHGLTDPTNPDCTHTLLGLQFLDESKPIIVLCEGIWDGMAFWEAIQGTEKEKDYNVLAVPGCYTFNDTWRKHFIGKHVVLLFDNDHSKVENGKEKGLQGLKGMQAVARKLLTQPEGQRPTLVSYLHWGDEGFDASKPSGFDVRDWIAPKLDTPMAERQLHVDEILNQIRPVPPAWLEGEIIKPKRPGALGIGTEPCTSWKQLVDLWRKALRMRQGLEDVLAAMLSVCLSTDQPGSQLFLSVIGQPGTAKTKFCEALLTSAWCMPVEKLKGFYSGYRRKSEDGEEKDFSLLARGNRLTWITAEGDLLLSAPNYSELMSEVRRIFDGNATSSFKNLDEDRVYKGLRTPWIIAGTPALLNRRDAHLGDRFLRIFVDKPERQERREIQMRAIWSMVQNTKAVTDGSADKIMDPKLLAAYKHTGGYVDYLRNNVGALTEAVETGERAVYLVQELAAFTALMRSRPDPNPDGEMVSSEEPYRLGEQLVRLAINLAAVWQRPSVDEEVLRVVRQVALDTSQGRVMDVCQHLYIKGLQLYPINSLTPKHLKGKRKGLRSLQITRELGVEEKKIKALLVFLCKIGVIEHFLDDEGKNAYRLSLNTYQLWHNVVVAPITNKRAAAMEES